VGNLPRYTGPERPLEEISILCPRYDVRIEDIDGEPGYCSEIHLLPGVHKIRVHYQDYFGSVENGKYVYHNVAYGAPVTISCCLEKGNIYLLEAEFFGDPLRNPNAYAGTWRTGQSSSEIWAYYYSDEPWDWAKQWRPKLTNLGTDYLNVIGKLNSSIDSAGRTSFTSAAIKPSRELDHTEIKGFIEGIVREARAREKIPRSEKGDMTIRRSYLGQRY
jgi:hypothetical protein